MDRKLVIEPVTRIEGHGKVTILLDEKGNAQEARLHVTQLRGFEKFVEGRLFWEMPLITPRICGICPVSHHLAATKAGDAILGVELSPTAKKLRKLLHMAQLVQSHALHFFHLASPDFLFGMDASPAKRNVMGLIAEQPELAKKGVMLRAFGQKIIEELGDKRVHCQAAIPGGMRKALSRTKRDEIIAQIDGVISECRFALDLYKDYASRNADLINGFASFPSAYMGLVDEKGNAEYYDGKLRFRNADGSMLQDNVAPEAYLSVIAEEIEDWSYLKFPFYKELGYPKGMYRVGPLGRLNVADGCSTPLANKEFQEFRKKAKKGLLQGSMHFHHARLIELVNTAEEIKGLVEDRDICGTEIRANTDEVRNREGVGVVEAPRGTLFHHYWVDKSGRVEKANLIVSTGHNNLAMNRAIGEVAREYIKKGAVTEGILNRVEVAIRCYDPCLSCSSHAYGQMPLEITIRESDGKVRQVLRA